ncbi:MAG: Regulatory protein AfsR [Syntrophomonadaceae bacterium]|nr:Regulatory protein AfsR [Bacillota bacterium]
MEIKLLEGTVAQSNYLEVISLGNFLVKNGETHFSENASRSRKVWDIFKYFLAHHGQIILPEVVVEQLWPEQSYADAKSSVRTLVYRLRRLLGDNAGLIIFNQGGYSLKQQENFWWDVPVFVSGCNNAQQVAEQGDESLAASLYRSVLSLYKGDFLPECAYSDWVIPFRNHYHRLYLQSVCHLLAILKKNKQYAEIIAEATKALFIDFFEEEIHLFYIEALLAEGKTSQARSHYQNATAVFYREMGIKPSPALKRLFRQLQSADDEDKVLEFSTFRETLQNREEAHGAIWCEPDIFRFLCRLESKRQERTGQQAVLVLLSISTNKIGLPDDNKNASRKPEMLQDLLQTALRKSDVLCRFNEHQFILLLPASSPEQTQKMLQRVEEGFRTATNGSLLLKTRLQLL